MSHEEILDPSLFYTIVGGTFRTQIPQDDPKAVRRDWQSADGKTSGTKYERVINALIGYITDIQFFDGEYGLQIVVSLDKDAERKTPKIALGTASREAESFMKRLPNVDLEKEVRLRPFSFNDQESGDEVRGMEVLQADENGDFTVKIKNYFRDEEKKENSNGFPNPEGETDSYSKDDWKMYFLQARKFLITYTKEMICPKIVRQDGTSTSREEYPVEDPAPEEVPF